MDLGIWPYKIKRKEKRTMYTWSPRGRAKQDIANMDTQENSTNGYTRNGDKRTYKCTLQRVVLVVSVTNQKWQHSESYLLPVSTGSLEESTNRTSTNKDHWRMMVNPILRIVYNSRLFLIDFTPSAVAQTGVIL